MIPLWSISVEEQFYLLWPSVVRNISEARIYAVAAIAWFVSQVAVLTLCFFHVPVYFMIWANSFAQLQYFALGAMIGVALARRRADPASWMRFASAALGAGLLFAANFWFDTTRNTGAASLAATYPGYLITGAGAVLLFLGVLGADVPRFLRPMTWLGKISYGLYVYHMPCVLFSVVFCTKFFHLARPSDAGIYAISLAAGLPLTITTAALSYRYLEAPFLRLKARFTIVESRAV
jgi:peptidoglycan/LPS O-acetylase OafA/YrhL